MGYYKASNIKIDGTTLKYNSNGELVSAGGGGGGDASIDDINISTSTTYSSSKIESRLGELYDQIEDDFGGTVLTYNDTLAVLGVPPSPFYQYRIATKVMTSNTTPTPNSCSSSSSYSGYEAWKAFRQTNDGSGWMTSNGSVVNEWIRYAFAEPKVIGRITIQNIKGASPVACKKFKLQGSNDAGASYTDLATCNVTSDASDAMQSFDIENSTEYAYYRIFILEGYDNNNVGFGMINLLEKYRA